jgi:hypothetical protein
MRAREPVQHCRTEKDPSLRLIQSRGSTLTRPKVTDWPRVGVAPPLVSEPSRGLETPLVANTGTDLRHPKLPCPAQRVLLAHVGHDGDPLPAAC